MNIRSTFRPQTTKTIASQATAKKEQQSAPEPQSFDYKDAVVKGAFASGGAITGVGLGVLTGQVMGNLTGAPVFTTIGGAAGLLTGAGTALTMADSDEKWKVLKDVTFGWGGGTAGSAMGQLLVGEMIKQSSSAAGMPALAAAGPLIGTAAGAIVGGALPFYSATEGNAKTFRDTAISAGGTTAGLLVGTGARVLAMSNPAFEGLGLASPLIGAATGGAIALAIADDKDNIKWANDTARVAGMGALGYGVGSLLGGIANAGGSSLYGALPMVLTPLWGAGGLNMGFETDKAEFKKTAGRISGTGTVAIASAMGGDMLGLIMSEVTGQALYRPLMPAIAALSGGGLTFAGSSGEGQVNDRLATAAVSGVFGLFGASIAGATGAGLTALTGNGVYNAVGGVVGGSAGVMAGLSTTEIPHMLEVASSTATTGSMMTAGVLVGEGLTAISGNPFFAAVGAGVGIANGALVSGQTIWGVDTKGAMESALGATGGTAAGVALGEGLTALTGQSLWKHTMPVLGAVAGGLGGMAFDILTREDGDKGGDKTESVGVTTTAPKADNSVA